MMRWFTSTSLTLSPQIPPRRIPVSATSHHTVLNGWGECSIKGGALMETSTLIHTLVTRGDYEVVRGSHQTLRLAAISIGDDDRWVLRALLDYAERYAKYPSYVELEEYLVTSHHVASWDPNTAEAASRRCHDLAENQDGLSTHNEAMAQLLDARSGRLSARSSLGDGDQQRLS
jgi:hypothetical protein